MEYNTKEAQTFQLKAQASLCSGLDSATYPVEGEWELPDGTKVTGAEASYTRVQSKDNNSPPHPNPLPPQAGGRGDQ